MRFEGVLGFSLATAVAAETTAVNVVAAATSSLLPTLASPSQSSLLMIDNGNEAAKIDNNDDFTSDDVSSSFFSSALPSSSSHSFHSGLDEHSNNIEQTQEEPKINRKYLRVRRNKNSINKNDLKHNKEHDTTTTTTTTTITNKINVNHYDGVEKYRNHHQAPHRKLMPTDVENGNNSNNDDNELWSLQEPHTTIEGQSFLNEVGDDPNAVAFGYIFERSSSIHLRTWDGSWKSNFYLPSPDDVPIGSKIKFECGSTWGFNVHYLGKKKRVGVGVRLNTNDNLFLIVFEVNDDDGNGTTRLWLTEQDVDAPPSSPPTQPPTQPAESTEESEYESCTDDPNFRFKGIGKYTCHGFVSKNARKKCKYIDPITGIPVRESCPTYCKQSCPPCADGKGLIRLEDSRKFRCKDIKRLGLCDATIETKKSRAEMTTTTRKAELLCPVSCDYPMCRTETSEPSNAPTSVPSNAPTDTPTNDSGAPEGTPKGCIKKGIDNNGTSNADCAMCTLGNTGLYHPCNANPPRCYGLDCENSPNWTGPRYKVPEPPGDGECRKKGFANNGVTDETCAQCTLGLSNLYYPCNEIDRCEGPGCKNSPHWAGDR